MNGLSVAKNMLTSFCVSMDWGTLTVKQYALLALFFQVSISAKIVSVEVCTAGPAPCISIAFFRYTGFW